MKTYFIISTFRWCTYPDEQLDRFPESPEEKCFLILCQLSFLSNRTQVVEKCTDLIIVDPLGDNLTKKIIKEYFNSEHQNDFHKNVRGKVVDLINNHELVNRKNLGIEVTPTGKDRIQSIDAQKFIKIIDQNKTIFYSAYLDKYLITILLKLQNIAGYHTFFLNDKKATEEIIAYPRDFLQFSEVLLKGSRKKISALLIDSESLFQSRGIKAIKNFLHGTSNVLLLLSSDQFINELIANEIKSKISCLIEYNFENDQTIPLDDANGLIFYKFETLSPAKQDLIFSELLLKSYSNKPVIIFSSITPFSVNKLPFEKAVLKSLNEKTKVEMLIHLLLKRDSADGEVYTNLNFSSLLKEISDGKSLNEFIINNKTNFFKANSLDYWYKYRSPGYKFRHKVISGEHRWVVSGDDWEEPLRFKYYPNKFFMYLVVLIKIYPKEISALDLYTFVEEWASKAASLQEGLRVKKNKAKSPEKNILAAYDEFRKSEEKSSSKDRKSFLLIFDKSMFHLGKYCNFNPKDKHLIVTVFDEDIPPIDSLPLISRS